MLAVRCEPTKIVALGINPHVERYCFEMERLHGIVIPKGDQHVGVTFSQCDEFYHFRSGLAALTRDRYHFVKYDLALERWLRERPEDLWQEVAGMVDCDGWVKLTPRELQLFLSWRDYKWQIFSDDENEN